MKIKACSSCDKTGPLWKSSPPLCKDCAMRIKAKEADLNPVKPRTPIKKYKTYEIRKVSTRQQRLNSAYMILRNQFLKDNPMCEAKINEYCTKESTSVHHKRGRYEYLLDSGTFLATCAQCHSWIEVHPKQAKALGFSLNRLDNIC